MELEVVAETLQRVVLWNKAARKEFDDADEIRKNRISAVIRLWCEETRLTPEQFNPNEGRAQKGSINRRVSAFKTHKVRLYGFERQLLGKRCYIAVACDPQKKSNKGKVRVLDAAKARVIDLEERFGGKYED
jgi:hypothetical protein